MRTALFVLLLALTGCRAREETPAQPPGSTHVPRDAPLQLGEHAGRGVTAAPDRVRVKLDLAQLRMLVEQHRNLNEGRAPASLAELPLDRVFYPDDVTYEPVTGSVGSKAYPDL